MASATFAEDHVIADFEAPTYGEWSVDGDAFGTGPATGTLPGQQDVTGFRGSGLVNSYLNGDRATGTLTSPKFRIEKHYLSFLIGGGRHAGETGIELLVDGNSVATATGQNQEMLSWEAWDVRDHRGKTAQLRIFDRATGDFGHINVDQILATDTPRSGPGLLRLSEYRKTSEYYRERYRPQFHFTPPMNWMNDPNGLVYYDGEYHLFYQHNPHGNTWGHMSWGHAVSSDLVRWQHLPIALHEEYGVMVFSGSCVVDEKNTSGFGRNGQPPLVAIYTGHGLGKQTQDIAYSRDRGRTWTKYAGNPVLDRNEANFRDPKVFWHEPTSKWVMIVSMANAKYVQFYGSVDLKKWEHLSDFGPAGVPDKPNWECPDLFELPVEGTEQTKWVLEVDMGSGAVAGGSGGEYFVGHFDGQQFECEHDLAKSQWVDYGRDFYAPVSFSDIPQQDGRRIWIGWMNNWETSLLPTQPWRSAMSIPRVLSLRKQQDRMVMVQKPITELRQLRQHPFRTTNVELAGDVVLDGLSGDRLEIQARFDVGTAEACGLRVRAGESEATIVGYDARTKQLFVDRTKSGESSFHPRFAGKHSAPLDDENGRVELTIFVDVSSIEVFADDGAVVLTERIFPALSSQGVSTYAHGGQAILRELKAWRLESIWPR